MRNAQWLRKLTVKLISRLKSLPFFTARIMPLSKPSMKCLTFLSEEGLKAHMASEEKAKKMRLSKIEKELFLVNGKYFEIEMLMKNNTYKNLAQAILSKLDFESLIQARKVSKTWYAFLENERDLWIKCLRKKLEFLKKGSLCDYNQVYINKKYPQIQVLFEGNEKSLQWEIFAKTIEQKGAPSDFIMFIQRMEESFGRQNHYCGGVEMKIVKATYEFEHSPLEAAINHGKYYWCDLKFLKILKNHKFLHGVEALAKRLVFWAVAKMKGTEALECVLSILPNRRLYTHYDLEYGNSVLDPIYYSIRRQDVNKLKLLIPLATSGYWNSGSPAIFGFRYGHSPMIDAIMVGDFAVFETLIPITDMSFPCHELPDLAFRSPLYVAIRYGRFEIFKHLCGVLKDWKNVLNKEGFSVCQTIVDKNYAIEVNDMESGPICSDPKFAKKDLKEDFHQKMIKFLNEN